MPHVLRRLGRSLVTGASSGQVQAADPGVQREDEREHDARHHRWEAG